MKLRLHPEFTHEESESVGRFLDDLARGFARTVAGLGLDADERRRRPGLAPLQAAQAGQSPTLIRIDTKAGHGAGKPTTKLIEEAADKWAFLVRELKMNPRLP